MSLITLDDPTDGSLRRLQAGYRQLFERYPLPMLVVDRATLRLLAANDAAARCYGYSVAQITGLHLPDLYFEEDQAAALAYMVLGQKERERQRAWRHRGSDGRAIDVEMDSEDMVLHGLSTRMLLVQDVTRERAANRARHSADGMRAPAMQVLDDGFIMLDRQARFISVNERAQALLQLPHNGLLGMSLWETCPQAAAAPYQMQFDNVVHAGQPVCFEFFLEKRQIWVEVRAHACSEGVAAYLRDVSAMHANSQRLQQESERLKAVVSASTDAIISVDRNGLVQSFNPAAERVFGFCSEYMVGKNIHLLVPERFRSAHVQHHERFSASDDAPRMMGLNRVKGLRADGHEVDLEGTIAQVQIGQEKVLIATLRDVTARDQALAERQAAQTQLSQLAQRLMSQEKELVKRIAQALHDQLGQTTAAIRVIHESMGVLRRGHESREYLRLDQQLGKLIDQATRQVRMVLVDLHPPLLDEHGLAAALDNELRSRSLSRSQLNFVLHAPPDVQALRWPSAIEYGAFMVAREALENALRHSQATQVTLSLGGSEGLLDLEIIDNGLGIGPGSRSKVGHLGITGMLERAQSIGGTLTIRPVHPGTRVHLHWKAAA